MQYLLLSRHGNTFAPGQKVVWVGATNDLPLVESGIAQAHSLSKALKDTAILPSMVYAANLKRTSTYAQIICDDLRLTETIIVDNRLNEIDYGAWTGLSESEIKEKFGGSELEKWNEEGIWPESFGTSESEVAQQVQDFAKDIVINNPDRLLTLAVTSNGRLKYFLKLIPSLYADAMRAAKWKVATGNVSVFAYEKAAWQIICWNVSPESACGLMKTSMKTLAGNR